jgi:hypothetical protein
MFPIEQQLMVKKMTLRSRMYGLKERASENLPEILHYTGSVLSAVSGMSSLPNSPAYGLNVAVGIVLGWEGLPERYSKLMGDWFSSGYNRLAENLYKAFGREKLPHEQKRDYQFSSKHDRLVWALRGCRRSEKLKAIIGVGLGVLPLGLYLQGHKSAALENALFDLGVWVSVVGSDIERRRILNELDSISSCQK